MEIFITLLNILGALGLFLYGMKLMSEALQRLAGPHLRRLMERVAGTPVSQITTTAALTAVIQSSSAVTLMIVGFVNAGLVTLRQAVGMIMGANVGTTLTAWIIAFFGFELNFSMISIPLIGLGFAMMLMPRRNYRSIGETVIGFALLFLALGILQMPLAEATHSTRFFDWLSSYTELGYWSVLLFTLVGTLLTVMLQSSSATIAVTIMLCTGGWIPLEAAAGMIVGENIGTTVTANLGAIVANSNARRAALSHTLINVFGMIWILPLIPWAMEGLGKGVALAGYTGAQAIPFILAAFHTLFNVLNVCLLAGFIPYIVRAVSAIIPSRPADDRKRLFALESGLVATPELSLIQANNEIIQQGKEGLEMFIKVRELTVTTDPDEFQARYREIEETCRRIDQAERDIFTYLSRMVSRDNGEATGRQLQYMFRTTSQIRLIAEHNREMAKTLLEKKQKNLWFNQELRDKLNGLFDLVQQAMYVMLSNLQHPSAEGIGRAEETELHINTCTALLREERVQAARQPQEYKYLAGVAYIDMLNECEKLADTILHISLQQRFLR